MYQDQGVVGRGSENTLCESKLKGYDGGMKIYMTLEESCHRLLAHNRICGNTESEDICVSMPYRDNPNIRPGAGGRFHQRKEMVGKDEVANVASILG